MEILAQCHKDAAMIRVLLGDPEAEHLAVEPLRRLLVGDPQIDVPDARQLDHSGSPMSHCPQGKAGPHRAASRMAAIAQMRSEFAQSCGILRRFESSGWE